MVKRKIEIFFVAATAISILALSFYGMYYHVSQSPKNTVFPLVHNHLEDYHFYLQLMKQSYDGRLLFISRYTPEDFPARFVHFTFLLLGKVAKYTSLDLPLTYNLSRLLLGLGFIILIYGLIKKVFPEEKHSLKRAVCFFLVIFGTGFWTFSLNPQGITIHRFLSFWNEVNPAERLVYIPHHLSAKLIALAGLLLLVKSISSKNKTFLAAAGLLGMLSGLSSPYVLLNLNLTLLISLVPIVVLYRKNKNRLVNILTSFLIFITISSLSLLYLRMIEKAGFPWNSYIEWEKMVFPISFSSYFLFSGVNFILGLLAVPAILKRKKLIELVLLSWFFEPWIGIFVLSPFLPVQNVRFLAAASFIPSGILATYGFFFLSKKIGRLLNIKPKIVLLLFLSFAAFIFAVDIWGNIKNQLNAFNPSFYNVYLPKELIAGFKFLDQNTPFESVVLSQGFMGVLIPSYSHNKTVIGHPRNTFNIKEKKSEIEEFFKQKDVEKGKNILRKYNVRYIFYSLDTPPPDQDFVKKLKLEKVYFNPKVSIYKVRNTFLPASRPGSR